ncbi:MAG: DUF2029 domain-containing protein [Pirellulales bacterium]|nr:DUF2029 domain-containing protein [Pirellulales bacterium]
MNKHSLPLGVVHGLWIAFAVAVCVKAIVQSSAETDAHSVFPILAAGSMRWWQDLPLHEYLPDLKDIYRYSPTFAILFTPLAVLPRWLGGCLWNLLSVGTLFTALTAMVRDLLPGDWPEGRRATFFGLALLVSASGIWSAQSNSLLIALVIFACSAIVRRRWWVAAVLLALPVYIKLWPLAIVLLLITFWPKELLGRFLAVAVVLALLPFLTRPPSVVLGQYCEWYVSLTGFQQQRCWTGYRDAWTIWENVWPPVSPIGYHVLQLATGAMVWVWCFVQWRRLGVRNAESRRSKVEGRWSMVESHISILDPRPSTLDSRKTTGYFLTLVLSIWAAWQLLFGPGSEQLTYGILAPSAAWAVTVSFAAKRNRLWMLTTCILIGLLGSGDVEKTFEKLFLLLRLPWSYTILMPLSVASFAVWLLCAKKGAELFISPEKGPATAFPPVEP